MFSACCTNIKNESPKGVQNGAKMDPKSKKLVSANCMCFSPRLEMGLEGCAEEFLGPKIDQAGPKVGPAGPKAGPTSPKVGPTVPKGGQTGATSANLIGLRKVSRPKVCPIFETPDQPPKRPGMLSPRSPPCTLCNRLEPPRAPSRLRCHLPGRPGRLFEG